MRTHMLIVAALALGVSLPASASYDIVKKARCVSCHALEKKMVGPAYREIAAKYAGQADAPAKLFAKVREGGAGVWGQIPMTPNDEAKISDENLKAAIDWILAGAEK
ncbi:c-type cytochrome [Denitromonas iodatirespirans]|uniref:C-type cytochrome n=1 Tax=Denitromonas iodatirespirans TaxID=2795389 RepID=A0A944D7L9_DENI1|nr:c-type cytochrome [Denitromonas iodatirespirans]MBT0961545.1 c-type cytochrome [Denitromonas iodatirespirans]